MEKLNYERMSRNMLQHKLNVSASTYYNLNETISISSPSSSSSTQKQTATFRLHFRAAIFLPLGSKFRVNFSNPSAREPTTDTGVVRTVIIVISATYGKGLRAGKTLAALLSCSTS